MKKYLIPLLLLTSPQVYSRTYANFHAYVYSIPVKIENGNSLEKVLKDHGYNSTERDWLTITLHMNGIRKEELGKLSSSTIYLPPKKAFNTVERTIASVENDKKICEPVSKNYLVNRYGRKNIAYLDYYELLTSRKVHATKGTSVDSLIDQDQFSYGSHARATKLISEANGIKNGVVRMDSVIHLPFCADALVSEGHMVVKERKVASTTSAPLPVVETKIVRTSNESSSLDLKYSAGLSYGSVNIERGPTELSSNFAKANFKARQNLNKDYSAGAGATIAQFYNVKHSLSSETKSVTSVYPELTADITRNFNLWKLAFAYDYLNYFIASDSTENIKLNPAAVHRLSLKPFVSITDHFGVFGGIGYLKSFGSEKITGNDYTAGVSYSFGYLNDYNLSAMLNQNTMNTAQSSQNDKSRSWVLAFNKSF